MVQANESDEDEADAMDEKSQVALFAAFLDGDVVNTGVPIATS